VFEGRRFAEQEIHILLAKVNSLHSFAKFVIRLQIQILINITIECTWRKYGKSYRSQMCFQLHFRTCYRPRYKKGTKRHKFPVSISAFSFNTSDVPQKTNSVKACKLYHRHRRPFSWRGNVSPNLTAEGTTKNYRGKKNVWPKTPEIYVAPT